MQERERDLAEVIAEADMSRFLSACFYEPSPMFGEERLFDSILEAAGRLDGGLAASRQALRQRVERLSGEGRLGGREGH